MRRQLPPPPSNRRVPRRMTSKGEGGWALWRPQGSRRPDRWPPGRCPFRDTWRIRGLRRPRRIRGLRRPRRNRELGMPPWRSRELEMPPWRSRKLGRPWRVAPPQNSLGEPLLRGVLRRSRHSGFWGAGRSRQGLW